MKIVHKIFNKQNFHKLKSLRLVTILLCIVAAVGSVFICGRSLIYSYKKHGINKTAIEVKSQCSMASTNMSNSSYLSDISQETINTTLSQITYAYSARILVVNSDFVIVKDTYSYEEGKTLISQNVLSTYKGNSVTEINDKTGYIDISVPIYDTDGKNIIGVINITLTDTGTLNTCEYLNNVFTAVVLTIILVSITLSILVSNAIVKPLYKLSDSITHISSGVKGEHVEKRTLYEYNRVSEAVNLTLDKIKTIMESREEFVSNVSHELKTPMTSMKVLADSLINQPEVPNELYREFMEDIVNEIDRENKVISDLLELVRIDRANAELNITTVNVNEFVELVLKRLTPIAQEKNIELVLESFRPFAAEIDEVKLTLAINNLVENAIKYNVENGWVRVSINADHKYFYIKVADSGIGIPQESIEQIFNRFYRVDKARSRQTGGTGLGLAITKSIVLMHKGIIKVYSKENEGTTFTIRIPLYHGNTEVNANE